MENLKPFIFWFILCVPALIIVIFGVISPIIELFAEYSSESKKKKVINKEMKENSSLQNEFIAYRKDKILKPVNIANCYIVYRATDGKWYSCHDGTFIANKEDYYIKSSALWHEDTRFSDDLIKKLKHANFMDVVVFPTIDNKNRQIEFDGEKWWDYKKDVWVFNIDEVNQLYKHLPENGFRLLDPPDSLK